MKNLFTLLVFMVSSFSMSAQTLTIIDITSLQPLRGVEVSDPKGTYKEMTNAKGQVNLPSPAPESLVLFHPDFRPQLINPAQVIPAGGVVYMSTIEVRLDEVVVSSSKFTEKREDVAQQIDVLNARQLEFMNAQNSGDALTQTGNVFLQKSQLGGGSPILRGFEANKVLIVVDGIRMNNAIYRAGHLQNVIRLDNNMLDRVEVVYGPASTVYGSDALGGVMHFHTRKLQFSTDEKSLVTGSAFTRFSTVNTEKTGNFSFNVANNKWAFMLTGTYSDFGDLRQGNLRDPRNGDLWKRMNYAERINNKDSMFVNNDPNVQVQSGYKQYNVISKIGFKPNEHQLHQLNIQYTNTGNVNRYDRLQEYSGGILKFAEWYYGPETMLLTAYQGLYTKKTKVYDQLNVSLSFQDIAESRISRRFNNNNKKFQEENVNVISLNVDMMKEVKKHEIRYGAEVSYNTVKSNGYSRNIVTELESPSASRYPDGDNSMMYSAIYVTHSWEINDKLILTDGLRFSNVSLDANFSDTSLMHFPYTNVQQKNSALTGSLGLIVKPAQDWRIALLGSTGFRAPNIDDVGKVFDSSPGMLIVPNPDLKPEYTYNADLTIEKSFNGKVRLGVTGYYTYLTNLITVQKFTFNGSDSIVYNGTPSLVTAAQNSDKGYIYGTSFNFAADVTEHFSITSAINYTYGRVITDTTDYPLDHIPPVFGRTAFILNLKKFRGEFYTMYSGWKRVKDYNLVGEDNYSQAAPDGMPAWCTLNVRASYQINKYLRVQGGIENITDLNYRVFASGISAPGRNFTMTLRANF
ncbi:MAG: TonB-dependent receptor [Flavobacteriales bacterium]|nr:TonB-dependent receptor [Flavobacteriales bacterium]